MILSHTHGFIFFCNGRTGTSSIEHALAAHHDGVDVAFHAPGLWVDKHIPPAIVRAVLPAEQWDRYFKFVFVRHPLDWFVSQYRYNVDLPKKTRKGLAKPGKLRAAYWAARQSRSRSARRVYDVADVDHLHDHLSRYRVFPGAATLLQSSYVFDIDGNRIVDFVGRFESLREDVATVQKRIGLEFELPHLNRTEHVDYRSCFTEAGAARVSELWGLDFERLGYEP